MSTFHVTITHRDKDLRLTKLEVSAETRDALYNHITRSLDEDRFLCMEGATGGFHAVSVHTIHKVNVEPEEADDTEEKMIAVVGVKGFDEGEAKNRISEIYEAITGQPFGGAL